VRTFAPDEAHPLILRVQLEVVALLLSSERDFLRKHPIVLREQLEVVELLEVVVTSLINLRIMMIDCR